MSFLWPEALWLLGALPLLAAAYVVLVRRKRAAAERFAGSAMVRAAMAQGAGWKRHAAPALYLVALAVLIVASARPTALDSQAV